MYIKVDEEEMIEIMKSRLSKKEKDSKSFIRRYFINKHLLFDVRQTVVRWSIPTIMMYISVKLGNL